jgi:tetratricopeptide (TPR) repeat protein
MPPQKLAERAKESEKLLEDPVENRRRIVAYLVRPGLKARQELLEHFENDLTQATSVEDEASLQYLIAETHYWGIFKEARKKRDVSIIEGAPQVVIPAYLRAFELVRKAGAEESAALLRADIIDRLRRLALSQLFGAALSQELKKQMITRFINPLEKAEDGPRSWTIQTRAKVYGNLGIGDRLSSLIPDEIPEDPDALHDAMTAAWSLRRRREALRFAEALEEREDLTAGTTAYETFKVLREMGSPRALPLIKTIASNHAQAYLDAYALSRTAEPDLSEAKRFEYVETFLQTRLKEDPASRRPYLKASGRLIRLGEYANALKVIDRYLDNHEGDRNRDIAHLLYRRGRCYEDLERTEEAVAAYRRSAEMAAKIGASLHKRLSRRALMRLASEAKSR